MLDVLDQHRMLTTDRLQAFCFFNHTSSDSAARTCRRVLARLDRLQVIEHLDRQVGGIRAGSSKTVWRIGLIGDRLLRQRAGQSGRARRKQPTEALLRHYLAVADAHLCFVAAARSRLLDVVVLQTEPACWRYIRQPSGVRTPLKPDLHIVTSPRRATSSGKTAADDVSDSWFLEIDRATESLPTLLHKCRQYEAYRRTGAEQDEHGVFPLVVWIRPDDRRADELAHAIQADRYLDPALFRVIASQQLPDFIRRSAQ